MLLLHCYLGKAPIGKIRLDNCVDFNMMALMQKKIGEAFIKVHNSTKKANLDEFPHSLFTSDGGPEK